MRITLSLRRCTLFTKQALIGIMLTLILISLPVASVYAAPATQTAAAGTCTIQDISISTSTGALVVTVTCTDGSKVNFNEADALKLGLIIQNADGSVSVNGAMIGQTIDTGASDPCAASANTGTGDTSQHPVGAALADFFCEKMDGATYDDIMGYHEDGFGFGVIAQALWFASELGVDPGAILEAKKSGDYEGLLPEGSPTPTNWGQFRKEVLGLSVQDVKHNLGEIMSGKAKSQDTAEAQMGSNTSKQTLSPA